MADHNDLGNLGEERAQAFLRQKGYDIKETNWVTGKLEIDIIALKDNTLVIVEVKTRSTEFFEHPKEAITYRKIKNLVNAAHNYIMKTNWMGETRFDVISVIPHGQQFVIEHIENAFIPPVNWYWSGDNILFHIHQTTWFNFLLLNSLCTFADYKHMNLGCSYGLFPKNRK